MQRLEAFIQKLEEGRREPTSWECEHALRALRALEESDFNARRAGDHVGRVACYASALPCGRSETAAAIHPDEYCRAARAA